MHDPIARWGASAAVQDQRPGGPFRKGAFTSAKRSERVTSVLGIALGVTFSVCLLTGLVSHFLQQPAAWLPWPSRIAGLYRVTQGLHVVCGVASIPLLAAKLWAVYPRLFQWPPLRSLPHLIERVSVVPLVAGSIFLLATGIVNIQYWYPFGFYFPTAHFWTAVLVAGALVVHVASQLPVVRRALVRRRGADTGTGAGTDVAAAAVERRRFLRGVAGATGLFALLVAGTTVRPLRSLALLAPRDPDVGPQGFPVNKSAASAGVDAAATGDDWRLEVAGGSRVVSFSRADLLSMPQTGAVLPIACVEGWSASQRWSGVRVSDLLVAAGVDVGTLRSTTFRSLERDGLYAQAEHLREFVLAPDALVALRVEGEDLDLDHGYPARVVIPNQPGVRQTKWLSRIEVA